jgi:response regulator of citrate/malate metabolism
MAYSKRPDLLFDLASTVERLCREGVDEPGGVRSVRSEQAPRVWRVRDRLSEADIRNLISRHQEGVTTRELAEHFNIGMTSVKRLLGKRPV